MTASIQAIPADSLVIPPNRQRRDLDESHIVALADSIIRLGLLHPPVFRRLADGGASLVAGECRIKAIRTAWAMGGRVSCGGTHYPENLFPMVDIGTLSDLDAFEAELEENIRRSDLSWQDRARATSQLAELRRLQAEKSGAEPPTVEAITLETRGNLSGGSKEITRSELLIASRLNDPDVAKAGSAIEALKIIRRKEETQRNAALAEKIGKTFSSLEHRLHNMDISTWIADQAPAQFDVILTDPPYGMDAQDFNDSGGKAAGGHFYDDSFEAFQSLMAKVSERLFQIAKPQAHLYMFCDIDRFWMLRQLTEHCGWTPFRTPLIWVNPTANRAPWPDKGPMRKWQMILYAIKGNRLTNHLKPDVLTYTSDPNLGHHAQKPVELFRELLARSCRPGDSVLDPFCGTGPIFPAAHGLKCKATGVEMDAAAYGIASQRIKALK